ncbi:hypothetical protein AA15669_0561 [Saccharibacter floricola DSM 15669]|uniref:Uncharacterized protein n=1 Tax=Saccharibacter floricola DSM 15669 TaxID=1123227 RepID=A0ABQ0NX79_9PROT|nr:hypothetical protein AA15669_0561 [Saccharibacter floricola DSM 15669]
MGILDGLLKGVVTVLCKAVREDNKAGMRKLLMQRGVVKLLGHCRAVNGPRPSVYRTQIAL